MDRKLVSARIFNATAGVGVKAEKTERWSLMSMKQPTSTRESVAIRQGRHQSEARRIARAAYPHPGCCVCDNRYVELAHLDHDPLNNDPDNLAWLCPTDHHRYDRGLIPLDGLKMFRAHQQRVKGKQTTLYMKDAGIKAAATRAAHGIGREIALKAVKRRRDNQRKPVK